MQYTEQELAKLISDLETEFTAHLAKAEASAAQEPLMKAEDEKEEKEPKSEEKEESKEAPAEEQKEEQKEEAPQEQKPEETPAAPQQNDESGYDPEEIAHMDKMYMSMSKAELLAHHDSCVRALDAIGAEHTHQQPEAQEQAPAPEMDKCGEMTKSENIELELAKSEVATYKAKTEELQKSLDAVQEFLTAFVKKVPQGKAVTSLEAITKSESFVEEKELSQSEINAILTKKASDPSLKKSDRDAINAYYFNDKNINKISHLLK